MRPPIAPARTLPALLAAALAAPAMPVAAVPLGPVNGVAALQPAVLPDGSGGAVVSYKTADGRVGAVWVDATGVPTGGPTFDPVAVPFTLEPGEPTRVSLGASGDVLVAADRATAGGAALTGIATGGAIAPGFPLALGMPLLHPRFVHGADGRTLLVAKGSDATSFWTVRTAMLGPDGALEEAREFASPLQFFNGDGFDATGDGAGGLVAVMPYYDALFTGSKDLCVFRYAADGSTPWGPQPVPIVAQPRDQTEPRILPDGAGGVFLAWTDPRVVRRSSDIFALRLDAKLHRPTGWLFYGQAVCDAPGPQSRPRIVRDGLGGMWVAWLDQRDGADGDLRYSHMLGNGELAPGSTTSGTILCGAPGAQRGLELAPDGAGGFFAVWSDERSGAAQLYLQHVMPSGATSPGWPADGLALDPAPGAQDQPAIGELTPGHVLIAWRDARSGTPAIHALALDDPNSLAAPGPEGPRMALAVSSPCRGAVETRIDLAAGETADLELRDLAGRTRATRTLHGPLVAAPTVLAPASPLEPGVYFVRLRGAHTARTARVSVLR